MLECHRSVSYYIKTKPQQNPYVMAMFEILQVTWEVFLCAVNVVTFIHYSNACHPESESPTKNSFREENIFLRVKGYVNSTSFINMIIVRKTQYAFYAIFYFLSILLIRQRTFFCIQNIARQKVKTVFAVFWHGTFNIRKT